MRGSVVSRPPQDGRPAMAGACTDSARHRPRHPPRDRRGGHRNFRAALGAGLGCFLHSGDCAVRSRAKPGGSDKRRSLHENEGFRPTLDFTCSRKRAKPAVGCQVQGRVSPWQGRIRVAEIGAAWHARTLPGATVQR